MQALTFRSLQVKDIGRTSNGKFYCSAFLGRLAQPMPEAPAAMWLPGNAREFPSMFPWWLRLRLSEPSWRTRASTVVLSPNAFDHWSRLHVRFMVLVTNRTTGQIAQIAGETLDVDPAWVLAQKEKQVAGELYRSSCSTHSDACVVTAESTSDILSGSRALLLESSGLGGLAGLGLSLAVAQFYLRRIGLAQQLRRAIRKGAIALVYQPIWELPSRRLVGAEALVRWSDEDGVSSGARFLRPHRRRQRLHL